MLFADLGEMTEYLRAMPLVLGLWAAWTWGSGVTALCLEFTDFNDSFCDISRNSHFHGVTYPGLQYTGARRPISA